MHVAVIQKLASAIRIIHHETSFATVPWGRQFISSTKQPVRLGILEFFTRLTPLTIYIFHMIYHHRDIECSTVWKLHDQMQQKT